MDKKIIDVAQWNKITDYDAVKENGVQGAIIKIINKQGNPDPVFERHYKGFQKAKIEVLGGYNYSYATTISKAIADANRVVAVAAGRIPKIWLDVEDDCQKGLGVLLINMIGEYQRVIEEAGLNFGVYTGLSFYNSYIKPYANQLTCDFWIARYPSSASMLVKDNPMPAKQPSILHPLCGWQYSSTGAVNGIDGNVDLNIWYSKMENGQIPQIAYPIPQRLIAKTTPLLRGDDVKWIQYHLIRLGFLAPLNGKGTTNVDGVCGDDTADAIIKAQSFFKISPDGVCGAVTRGYLNK